MAAGLWDVMKNGLYSIHVTLLEGRAGKGSGVILFRDGRILGGDAYLYYTGSYVVKDDHTFKGEVLVQRHTSPRGNDRHGAGRQSQPDFRRHPAQARRDRLEHHPEKCAAVFRKDRARALEAIR